MMINFRISQKNSVSNEKLKENVMNRTKMIWSCFLFNRTFFLFTSLYHKEKQDYKPGIVCKQVSQITRSNFDVSTLELKIPLNYC